MKLTLFQIGNQCCGSGPFPFQRIRPCLRSLTKPGLVVAPQSRGCSARPSTHRTSWTCRHADRHWSCSSRPCSAVADRSLRRASWPDRSRRVKKDALDGIDPSWPLTPDAATVAALASIDPTAFRDPWRAGRPADRRLAAETTCAWSVSVNGATTDPALTRRSLRSITFPEPVARAQRSENPNRPVMQNALARYTDRLWQRYTLIGAVARMATAEMIGKAPTGLANPIPPCVSA